LARPNGKIVAEVASELAAASRLAADAEIAKLRSDLADYKARYKAALGQIEAEKARADAIAGLAGVKPKRPPLTKTVKGRSSAVTAILVFSDWHVEEAVDPETVSGRNEFNLTIAEARVAETMRRALMLLEHESTLAPINRVVIAALGDFISGDIHDDTRDVAQLPPLAATRFAGELLGGCIDMAAERFREVIVATCNGNHGRSTPKPRIATDHQFSYEYELYRTMQAANVRKNVTYQLGVGYHNWLDLDGFKVRLHHGQAIRSNGGIGGVSISANKAIAQWNRMEPANLDIFGHHHQFNWLYNRYVSNGSLIGWNAFANFLKCEFQPPSQSLVLIDRDRGVTKAVPIFCDKA
jgi:hypothetical protein